MTSTEKKEWEGCITEIGANMTLAVKDDYNKGWNAASESAMRFIRRYIAGEGLFQERVLPPEAQPIPVPNQHKPVG